MMPAWNSHATVRDSVESVLAQTVPELELIVVDNASSPPIREVLDDVRDPRLRLVRLRLNAGTAGGRNAALYRARAPLVSQLDADDQWEPDYLESILPCFQDRQVRRRRVNKKTYQLPDRISQSSGSHKCRQCHCPRDTRNNQIGTL